MIPDPEGVRTLRGLACGGVLSIALWVPIIAAIVLVIS